VGYSDDALLSAQTSEVWEVRHQSRKDSLGILEKSFVVAFDYSVGDVVEVVGDGRGGEVV
jgi:hypothetical protein